MTGLVADVAVSLAALELEASLRVAPGETVAVLGPNGAGKTTLLRALAGLQRLSAGRVELDGLLLEDGHGGVPPEHRSVGFMFQDQRLFPHLDLVENVAFGLRARGATRAVARSRAVSWLERVGLGDRCAERPETLSGGQAQRVALARALATEPRLVLLDEPLSALDATTRAATRRDLRRHLDDHGGCRIVVTHDPVDAFALAQRLVVLEAGRVVQEGTPAEVASRPRSAYVAELVGVNLLSGTARGSQIDTATAQLHVAGDHHGPVLAVVHPRAVGIHREEPHGSARNVWRGSVRGIESLPGRARIEVGAQPVLVAEVTAAAVADLDLRVGDDVWLSVKATEIDVFEG